MEPKFQRITPEFFEELLAKERAMRNLPPEVLGKLKSQIDQAGKEIEVLQQWLANRGSPNADSKLPMPTVTPLDVIDIHAYCPNCGADAVYGEAAGVGDEIGIRFCCERCGTTGAGSDIADAWLDAARKPSTWRK